MLSSLCELLKKLRVTVALLQLLLFLVTLLSRDAYAVMSGTANILSLTDKQQILIGHNTWRSRSTLGATNMIQLRWSEELSTIAQNYSLNCPEKRDRNPNRNSLSTTFENVGENIANSTLNSPENHTYREILDTSWVESNIIAFKTCFGLDCEEYAQVLWANTEFVGCGSSVCANTTVVVCDYAPGATDLAFNASSLFPYDTDGEVCSACPSNAANCTESGLCYDASAFLELSGISSTVPTPVSIGQSSATYVPDSSSAPTPYVTITPSPSSAPRSIAGTSEVDYTTVNFEHSLSTITPSPSSATRSIAGTSEVDYTTVNFEHSLSTITPSPSSAPRSIAGTSEVDYTTVHFEHSLSTITPSPSSAPRSIAGTSEVDYTTVNFEHSLSNRPSTISGAQTSSRSVKALPVLITSTLQGTDFGSSSITALVQGSSATSTHHVTRTALPSSTSATTSRTGASETGDSMTSRPSETQTSSRYVKAVSISMTPTLQDSSFVSTDTNQISTLSSLESSSPFRQSTLTLETISSSPASSPASVSHLLMSTESHHGIQSSIQTPHMSVSELDSRVSSIIPTPTYSVTVPSVVENTASVSLISKSPIGTSHAKSIPLTVTVTVTQTPGATIDDSKSSCTENACCLGRLPLLYVLIIGIIPSVIAIALFLILVIVLCMNCRRNSLKIGKKYHYHFRSPDASNLQRQRRMHVHDMGLNTTPDTLTSVHLRPISPPTVSASLEPDFPLLPDPPATFVHEDYSRSVVGSTFNLVVPNNNMQDSSFSSFSNASSEETFHEEFSSRPPLECIREEIGESERETEQGGVARIIAKLEQGKGRILSTEC